MRTEFRHEYLGKRLQYETLESLKFLPAVSNYQLHAYAKRKEEQMLSLVF